MPYDNFSTDALLIVGTCDCGIQLYMMNIHYVDCPGCGVRWHMYEFLIMQRDRNT